LCGDLRVAAQANGQIDAQVGEKALSGRYLSRAAYADIPSSSNRQIRRTPPELLDNILHPPYPYESENLRVFRRSRRVSSPANGNTGFAVRRGELIRHGSNPEPSHLRFHADQSHRFAAGSGLADMNEINRVQKDVSLPPQEQTCRLTPRWVKKTISGGRLFQN